MKKQAVAWDKAVVKDSKIQAGRTGRPMART